MATRKQTFEAALERVRRSFGPGVYVVMPEHVHLPISEPHRRSRRYYDFNVLNDRQFVGA